MKVIKLISWKIHINYAFLEDHVCYLFHILKFLTMSLTSRLRDKIDELRRSFEPKENAIETLQQSLMEKDQVLKLLNQF